ncbi:hypothetical protein XM38_021150 [Halomicronema hongdechloris C2206]|uniref:DUF2283 domain-containing protein n=1 Tax=Halomicronema hongdechloris C2206 TaxID=1641165 RepID=A0A1Z3HLK3_9CYAN|nr:DUF2283 domain-containing protein [Halomicronema hongdechloris]ASC71165.1 hypothetical protein XM38_021150 [Halomicronema hongdechloris C2206]
MKIIYDPEVDVLRILFRETPISESDADESGIIFDLDAQGNVVGLEILDASQRIDDPTSVSYRVAKLTEAEVASAEDTLQNLLMDPDAGKPVKEAIQQQLLQMRGRREKRTLSLENAMEALSLPSDSDIPPES